MIHISHATGNQNSRQAALAFAEVNMLHEFAVALAIPPSICNMDLLGAQLKKELSRRSFPGLERFMRSKSISREFLRLAIPKLGIQALNRIVSSFVDIDNIINHIDARTAHTVRSQAPHLTAVYAYEDTALKTFHMAQKKGLKRFYELPIGYWRSHKRICEEEGNLVPQWAHTWIAANEPLDKTIKKDQELSLAQTVIVPSLFVKNTLSEFPGNMLDVKIVPYGCPPVVESGLSSASLNSHKLRILYVGAISQRKGLFYLIEALKGLEQHVEVTVLGSGAGISLLPNWWSYKGSLPHNHVLEEMRKNDIFIFPTLFEGYSLAVSEALSQGLPVITTPNSGAETIIENGKDGWIVPIRDIESIRLYVESLMRDRQLVYYLKENAIKKAKSWQWKDYRENLRDALSL